MKLKEILCQFKISELLNSQIKLTREKMQKLWGERVSRARFFRDAAKHFIAHVDQEYESKKDD